MGLLRLSVFLILMFALVACGQQEEGNKSSDNGKSSNRGQQNVDEAVSTGGIIAGKLEATLQAEGRQAIFTIKNQTEQVKELILAGKTSYEYFITNESGKTVFRKSKSQPQYEQKHPITLKQAEEVKFELAIPKKLNQGTYSLTAVLHTEPVLKAKMTFTIEK